MLKTLSIGAGLALLTAMPAFAACTDISSATVALTACVDSDWQPIEGTGAQEFVYANVDEKSAMMVITEKEPIPSDKFRGAILQNAVTGAGGSEDNVKVMREWTTTIAGAPFNVLEYTVTTEAGVLLFQNYYYSAAGYGSTQILTYSLEADATSAAFHAGAFAATVKLGG